MWNSGLNIKIFISWITAKYNTHSYEENLMIKYTVHIFLLLMDSGLQCFIIMLTVIFDVQLAENLPLRGLKWCLVEGHKKPF